MHSPNASDRSQRACWRLRIHYGYCKAKSSNHRRHPDMMHSRTIVDPESLLTSGRRWDLAIMGLLAALLAFAPAAFGAVEAWSQLIVLSLAATLAICLTLRVFFDPEFRIASTWLYIPLGLFLALVLLQLVPLPARLVTLLSPATLSIKQEMLGVEIDKTSLSF